MRTKLFTFLFAIVASIGIANAEIYSGTCGANLNWSLDTETGVLNITGRGDMNDMWRGSGPGAPWYDYASSVTTINLPEGLTKIGDYAFYGCHMASLSIPDSVTSIGFRAISVCPNLLSITIPDNVTTIGTWSFCSCTKLNSITFGHGLTTIPNAFEDCTSLTTITFPNNIQEIAYAAFRNCTGLISVYIPASVTTMGDNAFTGCTGLTHVYIEDLTAWCNIDFGGVSGNPLSYAHNLYLNSELVTDLVIPDGINRIDDGAFCNATCLTSVTIPASVKEVGQAAFSGCTNLQGVYISDLAAWCDINFRYQNSGANPLRLAHNLYLNGQLITDLVIPEGVDSIKLNAFSDLQCITSLSISKSVKYINGDAFSRCTNLLTILYNAKRCEDLPNGQIGFRDGGSYVPPISSVIFGNEVERIPASLFRDLSNITELVIPSNVKEIGELGFYGCSGLQKVTFENGIEKIGNYSFYQCSKIDSIVIPNSVTQIGMYAFYGCSSVKYASISNQLINIREYTFSGCRSLEGIVIPASVETIGQHAFDGCRSMQYVTCEAINPPVCGTQTFNYVDKSIPLYVPAASMETYAQADQWRDFSDIRPIGDIYRVSFVDFDGTEIKSEYVDGGQTATAPENPMREGYTFIGWDTDFSNVSEYLTVTAQYAINRFEVKFLNWDNSVLKTDSIDWHGSAVAPANPIREGYTFTSWDKTFDDITADLTVRAQFTINYYDVFFLNYDGQVLKEQSVQYNTSATAPNAPAREGYSFTGWSGEYSNVASRLFIVAQYEKEQTGAIPVRFVDVEGETLLNSYVLDTAPIAPIIVNRTFLGWHAVAADIADGIVIQATYEDQTNTAAPSAQTDTENPQKVLRDGNVYILRGNQTYTLTGTGVR